MNGVADFPIISQYICDISVPAGKNCSFWTEKYTGERETRYFYDIGKVDPCIL